MKNHLLEHNSILQRIDLDIATAGARGAPIDTVVLIEKDYKDFCAAVGHKDSSFGPWPIYRGLTVIKQKSKEKK